MRKSRKKVLNKILLDAAKTMFQNQGGQTLSYRHLKDFAVVSRVFRSTRPMISSLIGRHRLYTGIHSGKTYGSSEVEEEFPCQLVPIPASSKHHSDEEDWQPWCGGVFGFY